VLYLGLCYSELLAPCADWPLNLEKTRSRGGAFLGSGWLLLYLVGGHLISGSSRGTRCRRFERGRQTLSSYRYASPLSVPRPEAPPPSLNRSMAHAVAKAESLVFDDAFDFDALCSPDDEWSDTLSMMQGRRRLDALPSGARRHRRRERRRGVLCCGSEPPPEQAAALPRQGEPFVHGETLRGAPEARDALFESRDGAVDPRAGVVAGMFSL